MRNSVAVRLSAVCMLTAAASRCDLVAQTSDQARRIEFEVASVKPNRSREPRGNISFSPSGRFAWTNNTVAELMRSAYADTDFVEVVGGPSWLTAERFDIVATSVDALRELGPGGLPVGLFSRLRSLLEERFGLRVHTEPRVTAAYRLVPAVTPIRMGAALRPSLVDCYATVDDLAHGGAPAIPYGTTPPCSLAPRLGHLTGRAITMEQLAGALRGAAGRPVVDGTRLVGAFDVELTWAPDLPPGALLNGQPATPIEGPSIFTAVEEQLGLKLRASRESLPFIVVDQASRPTPD